jgi:hypothetical protein
LQGVCNGVRNALFAKCGCGKQIATAPPSALSSPESSPAMTSDPEDGSTTIGVSA